MTWNAYNRRMTVLREVLAIADRRRDDLSVDDVFAIVPEAQGVFGTDIDLLLDTQMLWFQRLNGQMERQLTEGEDTPEMTAINAWMSAAADMPGARALLDANAHRPELARAFGIERVFLAEAAGVPTAHPELDARGQRIVDTARDAVVYPPSDEPFRGQREHTGFMSRLRDALAA